MFKGQGAKGPSSPMVPWPNGQRTNGQRAKGQGPRAKGDGRRAKDLGPSAKGQKFKQTNNMKQET